MTIRESELIEGLKKGKNEAFRILFDTYYYTLFCVACRHVKDEFTADTLVGDVLYRLWEYRETLRIETSLQAYLVRSVRNSSINYLKQSFLDKEISLGNYEEHPEAILQGLFLADEYPLGRLIEKELTLRIRQEINRLPEETRKVFILSRIKELPYNEIARHTGISVNTVKYHIKQALSMLRKQLKEYLSLLLLLFIRLF